MSGHGQITRKILKDLLPQILLTILKETPLHAWGIRKVIKQKYHITLSTTILYVNLNKMEKEGVIKGTWKTGNIRPRKVYAVTGYGAQDLTYCMTEMKIHVVPLIESLL